MKIVVLLSWESKSLMIRMQKSISEAAEDHTRFHFCQQTTGNSGYNSHRLNKMG